MPRSLSWPQCLNQVLRWPAGRKEQRFLKLIHEINPFLFMTLCNTLQPEKSKVFDMSFDLVLWVALPPPSEWKQGVSSHHHCVGFICPRWVLNGRRRVIPFTLYWRGKITQQQSTEHSFLFNKLEDCPKVIKNTTKTKLRLVGLILFSGKKKINIIYRS